MAAGDRPKLGEAGQPTPRHPGDQALELERDGSPERPGGGRVDFSQAPAVLEIEGRGAGAAPGAAAEHPLAEAVRLGRFCQAERELSKLLDAGQKLDEIIAATGVSKQDVERLRRVVGKYRQSLELLNMSFSELKVQEKNEKLKLQWGLQVEGSKVRAMLSVERDLDFVDSLAAFSEKDLDVGFKENIVSVDPLGEHGTNENVWRVRTYNKTIGARGDDVIVECSCDALDEPLGSVWLCGASPTSPEEVRPKKSFIKSATGALSRVGTKMISGQSKPAAPSSWNGIELPPPDEGHNRAESIFFAMKLTPVGPPDHRRQGFRQTSVVQMQLSPAMVKILSMLPSFLVRSLARSTVEKNVREFEDKVKTHARLRERLVTSPRSRFYEHVRRHLCGEAALPSEAVMAADPAGRTDGRETLLFGAEEDARGKSSMITLAGSELEGAGPRSSMETMAGGLADAAGPRRRRTAMFAIGTRSLTHAF